MTILPPVRLCEFGLAATLPNGSSSSAVPTRDWSSSFGRFASIWPCLAESKFTQPNRAQYRYLLILGAFMTIFTSCYKVDHPAGGESRDLRINLRKEPASLDPRKGNDMVASQLHFMLFEGLVRLNSDMTISPAQAQAYEVAEDGRVYTFHLDNTFWSDGTPVTAEDFEKSWKSLLDPNSPSPDAYLLYAIKNARAAKEGKVPLNDVGLYARNPKTLIVHLEHPVPYFLQIVASSVCLPVNSKVDKEDPNWASSPKNFISNDPFKLKEWIFNQEMVLEKNPRFRNAKDLQLDHIFVEMIDRELATLHMYSSGHFDLIGAPLSFFPSVLQQDLEKKNLLTFFPVATTKFLSFNTRDFPFQNANIRRAFAYAINRKEIVANITQLKETAALNIIPPVLLANEQSLLFADADRVKAKECFAQGLKELGIDSQHLGPITFIYCSSEVNHLMAQELQNLWRKILDADVRLQCVEFKTLHERSKTGDYGIGLFAWVADYGDPMNILERFQDKANHRNYPKWENETYNLLLQQALETSTKAAYLEKVKEAEKILIEEMPITCLYHDNYSFLIQPYIQDFEISPLGHIYFDKISIDKSKK